MLNLIPQFLHLKKHHQPKKIFFNPIYLPKSEVTESLPQPEETPPIETENIFQPDLPSKPEAIESSPQPEETPPTETENPSEPVSPVATNTPPKPEPIEPTQHLQILLFQKHQLQNRQLL